ncbi:MAG: 3'-5' exonuclease [Gemmatimonadaceae bacterium]
MYLIVDTETNDLPRNWRAPVTDLANWPRVVQVAWLEFDVTGTETARSVHLICPDGFAISEGARAVHGITTARAKRDGVPLAGVLDALLQAITRARVVIAHNIQFDATILSAEYLRAGQRDPLLTVARRCTMKESADYCNIPGQYGPKWPKLEELYHHLFNERSRGAHDALADAESCARCFFELQARGVKPFAPPLKR